ncbi:DNA-dependent ATPase fun30 [Mycoemilia scoparia]|uniref:DNA-dependent ATPase fun30 n=1 Tax=Mycoemilia scoparia TaxID=417184 RepID=A0A9W7ZXX1_9FUNG|nr:DNA-dependent ATPase fun30 [Mycoemilia scoparia]
MRPLAPATPKHLLSQRSSSSIFSSDADRSLIVLESSPTRPGTGQVEELPDSDSSIEEYIPQHITKTKPAALSHIRAMNKKKLSEGTEVSNGTLNSWLAMPKPQAGAGQAEKETKEKVNKKSQTSVNGRRIDRCLEDDTEAQALNKFSESIQNIQLGTNFTPLPSTPTHTSNKSSPGENNSVTPEDVKRMIEDAYGSPPISHRNNGVKRSRSSSKRTATKRARHAIACDSDDESDDNIDGTGQTPKTRSNINAVRELDLSSPSDIGSPVKISKSRRLLRGNHASAIPTPATSEVQEIYSETDSDNDSYNGMKDDQIDAIKNTLKLFNSGSADDLVSRAHATPEEADIIVNTLRPFSDIYDIETRLRRTKGVRLTIYTAYYTIMKGYMEVDKVMLQCNRVAERVRNAMHSSGIFVDEKKGVVKIKDRSHMKPPKAFNPEFSLKTYQFEGVAWLTCLFESGGSGILADEMGLGKTCQVISFIANSLERGNSGPFMIICPSSTIDNWTNEFRKFAPGLNVESYYGSQQERAHKRVYLDRNNWDILVTTYNVATTNKIDRIFLKGFAFSALILDEGHMIKNCTSARYNWLMQIKSKFRLLLTGTPLQNNLQELMSLLSFIMPSVFGDSLKELQQAFKSRGGTIKKGTNKQSIDRVKQQASTDYDDSESVSSDSQQPSELLPIELERVQRAKHLLSPFVLRRRKIDVLSELPKKTEKIVHVDLCSEQQKVYNEKLRLFNSDPAQMSKNLSKIENIDDTSQIGELSPKKAKPVEETKRPAGQSWINSFMELRKVSNHPLLVRNFYSKDKLCKMARDLMKESDYVDASYDYLVEDMEVCSDHDLHKYCVHYKKLYKYQLTDSMFMDSGKIRELKTILDKAYETKEKALVFSQFTTMLDILERIMSMWNIEYSRLDGQTKVSERQCIIDDFNSHATKRVFLLSTKAGGFGINLTSASIVVIHDIDFNPHNDRQAEDRAHRVGQQKDVTVIKLIGKGTIEENIMEQAKAKLLLDENISSTVVN